MVNKETPSVLSGITWISKKSTAPKERRIVKKELKGPSALEYYHFTLSYASSKSESLNCQMVNDTRLDVGVAEKLLQPSYIYENRKEKTEVGIFES